ncbi:class I SAM-dependent methyltransferase [Enterococcus sp. LJL128]|uniref:class I SAM-dependent methyltransferase n=1 Tax=Enterococcus sp. LJL51 TaxID=3416656 RepID=UPI003CED1C28
MTDINLIESWLQSEQNQKNFSGWDFSYLKQKYTQQELPWCYRKLVSDYLRPDLKLLDIGTGGGELLSSFNHPFENTSVTESWLPNYQLLLERLKPKGAVVKFVESDESLDFPDNSFDLVLNSQASFSFSEVRRVLKNQGLFISQQVGDLNGLVLSSQLIPGFNKPSFDWHLFPVLEKLKQNNFEILYKNEAYPFQKFYDMDGLIYYVKTIPWEYSGFSVEKNLNELLYLNDQLQQNGFIQNQQHRFVWVARLQKETGRETSEK